jgi:4,5-dihydroxyphthalate decarboxylase
MAIDLKERASKSGPHTMREQKRTSEHRRDVEALPLSIAFAHYDRHVPLLDGRVLPEGITPTYSTGPIAEFCEKPVYEEFDIAEMSFSWYIAAFSRNEPVIALPIFPCRVPVHGYLFCRADSGYSDPRELIGKRVGSIGYRYTVNLWLRGILSERYAVNPDQMSWVTTEHELAGFVIPPEVDVTIALNADPEQMLIAGEVEAVFSPILLRDPRVRRLFRDARGDFERYYDETHILPITHTLVMSQSLYEREPWVARNIVTAFQESQRLCDEAMRQPKAFSYPEALFLFEEQRARFGATPYEHGIAQNRHILETFARYAHEQGYVANRPAVDDLFAPNTRDF